MRFIHRVSVARSSTPHIHRELADLGVSLLYDDLIVVFETDEQDPRWPAVQRWMALREVVDLVTTKFSDTELAEARWLELLPAWHHGYPQPHEDVFGYRQATYDLTAFCEHCGVGLRQSAPFHMRGEPRWGRKGILQLNWVFDEFFVTPPVWAAVFEPLGVPCRPVLAARGGELATVVQLVVDEVVDVFTDGLATGVCGWCKRAKILPVTRGPAPPLAGVPSTAMARTAAWFGSGGSAFRGVLVSQRVRQAMLAENVRGASMKPVSHSLALSA
jgi:hypothetical protein